MRRFRVKTVPYTNSKRNAKDNRARLKLLHKSKSSLLQKLRACAIALIMISPLLIAMVAGQAENQQKLASKSTGVSTNLCARVHRRNRCGTGDISSFLEKRCCRIVEFRGVKMVTPS
jgi:hypothetical protein